jgi:1-acyl-sn-glycerol-3-phosphate acyltransferase
MWTKIFYPLQILWRAWFYIAVFIAIVVVFPFITLFSLTDRWYRLFFAFARVWAYVVLILSGFYPRVLNRHRFQRKTTYIIVANHTSMLDIMLTYVAVPNLFLFVGKVELERIPVFGFYYRRTNILVDRSSLASRRDVFHEARKQLRRRRGVCIYPEGGVLDTGEEVLAPFKIGAFRLAVEEGIPILPMVFPDNKRRQPYRFLDGGVPGMLRAIILPPIESAGKDAKQLRDECFETMRVALEDKVVKQM